MADIIKRTLQVGVGLALKTWEEVEDLAKELIKKGKMSEKEGRKFLDDLQKKYEDSQKKLETRVEKSIKEWLKKADVVTGDEIKALRKEIRELKKMIGNETKKAR
jgi:polyhydroxyalkanoate synthesis regulator phasin